MAAPIKEETGSQLFARLGTKAVLDELEPRLFKSGLSAGDIVELYGEEGSGKTQMLLYLIGRAILPNRWQHVTIGGLETGVVLVDTDYHFSMLRLVSLLESTISHKLSESRRSRAASRIATEEEEEGAGVDVEQVIRASLGRLSVARCNSTPQLVATLHALDAHLSGCARATQLLMIDSAAAFYWIDRADARDVSATVDTSHSRLVGALRRLVAAFGLAVVATKPALLHRRGLPSGAAAQGSDAAEHYEYMGRSWQRFVTRRFTLCKDLGASFRAIDSQTGLSRNFTICEEGVRFT